MIFKVAFDWFYIAMCLSVNIDLDATQIKVFKVERIAVIGAVERLIFYHRDDYSARNLPREEPFVYIIPHTGGDAIAFAYDTTNRILCISNFKRFSLCYKHARRYVHLTNQQFAFVYLDAERRVCCVRH